MVKKSKASGNVFKMAKAIDRRNMSARHQRRAVAKLAKQERKKNGGL